MLVRHRNIAIMVAMTWLTRVSFLVRLAVADEVTDGETRFLLITSVFHIWGVTVEWMTAGLTMPENDTIRTKPAFLIRGKNINFHSMTGLASFSANYSRVFLDVGVERFGGLISSFKLSYGLSSDSHHRLWGRRGRSSCCDQDRLCRDSGLVLPDVAGLVTLTSIIAGT